jgi:hypothetical protein
MSDPNGQPRFVLVPADLVAMVAERKISKEAGWLYIVLLGHHNRTRKDNDVWPSRQVLAEGMGLSKPQSVDKYLAELRDAGLIVSEQRKRAGTFNTSSKHTLLLFVPRTDEEIAARKARHEAIPYNGQRYPRQRTAAIPSRGYELEEVELEELNDVDSMRGTSGRSAPASARDGKSKDQLPDDYDPWSATGNRSHERPTWENWHDADREKFRRLVGNVLVSDGSKWDKGRFSADGFYRAFRAMEKNRKRWPGEYVEALSTAGDYGIEDWLLDQGLTRAD